MPSDPILPDGPPAAPEPAQPGVERSMSPRADAERTALDRKLTFFRRTTAFLAVTSLFLGLVVIAQWQSRDEPDVAQTPTAEPAAPAPAEPADGTDPAGPPQPVAPEPTPPGPYADSVVVRRDAQDPMALGAVDAPVVVSQWTDFRCPYCAAFGRGTLPAVIEEYVETGLVRLEVHDVAYFGEESEAGAVAARAAGRQGRYFEFLAAVSASAPEGGNPDLSREALLGIAEQVEVADLDAFTADLDDPALLAEVQESTATAQYLGVSGVPFFVVGEAALSGAYPIDVFRQVLDEALATLTS